MLLLVCACTVFLCVNYLRLRSAEIRQRKQIEQMEENLRNLRSENEAVENEIGGPPDLEEIKDIAINKLGLHYPDADQIRYYSDRDIGYVRQYTDP